MILLLELSHDGTHLVEWNGILPDFPKLVKYNGARYEWIMWDPGDANDPFHYRLTFATVTPSKPYYHDYYTDLDDIKFNNYSQAPITCECGSHKPTGQQHGYWCKLYKREM